MYHPGKVVRVFQPKDKDVVSADEAVHALVDMWDDNVFTVLVDNRLADKVREGDIVIVDYYPIAAQSQFPKRVVTKILRGRQGEAIWKRYAAYKDSQSRLKETHEHETGGEYLG